MGTYRGNLFPCGCESCERVHDRATASRSWDRAKHEACTQTNTGSWKTSIRVTKKGTQVSSRRPWHSFTMKTRKIAFLMVRKYDLSHFLPLQMKNFPFVMVKKAVSLVFSQLNQAYDPFFMTDSPIFYHCKFKNQVSHGKNFQSHKNSTMTNVQNGICHGKI